LPEIAVGGGAEVLFDAFDQGVEFVEAAARDRFEDGALLRGVAAPAPALPDLVGKLRGRLDRELAEEAVVHLVEDRLRHQGEEVFGRIGSRFRRARLGLE
jgi:hypothetical protein